MASSLAFFAICLRSKCIENPWLYSAQTIVGNANYRHTIESSEELAIGSLTNTTRIICSYSLYDF